MKPMISLSQSASKSSSCLCCESRVDVRGLTFAWPDGNNWTTVHLCSPCRALTVAAMPPDSAPTGDRKPCAGWLNVVGKSDRILNLIPSDSDCGAVTLRVYGDGSWSVSALDGCETVHLADGKGGELAAEDAAAELLTAGLRALGRIK